MTFKRPTEPALASKQRSTPSQVTALPYFLVEIDQVKILFPQIGADRLTKALAPIHGNKVQLHHNSSHLPISQSAPCTEKHLVIPALRVYFQEIDLWDSHVAHDTVDRAGSDRSFINH